MPTIAVTSSPDSRLGMEFDVAYDRTDETQCTFCGRRSARRTDTTVTKQHWGNRPLGQLITRCPEHQEQAR